MAMLNSQRVIAVPLGYPYLTMHFMAISQGISFKLRQLSVPAKSRGNGSWLCASFGPWLAKCRASAGLTTGVFSICDGCIVINIYVPSGNLT